MSSPSHRALLVPGPAGRLEAILWSSQKHDDGSPPPLAAVVCHPHPQFGGTMHNKVVYQTAKTLHRFGLPVLRFNFRGVGLSEGTYDNGRGERKDVLAALDFLVADFPGVPLLVAGFSFGSWVGLRAGCGDSRVRELIGLGLPVGDSDRRGFAYLEVCEKPMLLVSGELDPFGSPEKLKNLVAQFPSQAREQMSVAIVSGADHFFTGHIPELAHEISTWLISRHPDLSTGEAK